jgi:diguanylate cyclase (GGDEF)-like protein/PAS domain S-box-containing protein
MRHGEQAVNQVASQLRASVTQQIVQELDSFLAIPHLVNQINYDAIQSGQLNPGDDDALFQHFLQQSHQFPLIDSIFFGHANQAFIGHSDLGTGHHQRMQGGPSLGGTIQFSTVDDDGNTLAIQHTTPGWNTHTRPWYTAAVQAGGPVWGKVFPYHAYPMLALPTSRPVYDTEGELIGVLGNNFFLSEISDFLATLKISDHGQAFILDRKGLIVASSTLPDPFVVVEGQPQRLYSVTSQDPLIRASSQFLLRQYNGYLGDVHLPQQFEFQVDRQRQFVDVVPFRDEVGLDWLVVVVVPERDFMAAIEASRRYTVLLCLLALAVALGLGLITSRWISRPISQVRRAAQAMANGQLHHHLPTSHLGELEQLVVAFNHMAQRIAATVQDLEWSKTDLETANAEIQQQSALFRLMADNMTDLVCLQALDGTYLYISPSVEWTLGYQPSELLGTQVCDWVHPADVPTCHPSASPQVLAGESAKATYRMRHKLGHYLWIETLTRPILNDSGEVIQLQTAARDVTETMRMRKQLQHDALHDSLTGLPNRKLLQDRLELALNRTRRHRHYRFAVLFLDVDRFKVVNDSLGHLIGDELLIEIASRLRNVARPTDLAARLGGDEFILLMEDVADLTEVVNLAEIVLANLRQPLHLSSQEVFTTVSVGIVMGNGTYADASELLRDADIAMYRAKNKGRDGYEVFNSTMHTQAITRLQLETELRRSLLEHPEEFVLHYQPIVDLATAEIQGFETLVRWQHPQRGLVPPNEFIPLAEETGLIIALSYHLMETACRQLRIWQRLHPQAQDLTISVNLAAMQLHSPGLLAHIDDILIRTGLSPRSLVLEITESMLIDDIQTTLAALHALRQRSIALSIDDFGTGYSSLSYLYQFPINHLKIDRSFVSQMQSSPHHHKLVETIITLAHQLGFTAIAEGIESEADVAILRSLACDLGQGYWFGKPQPADVIGQWLAQDPNQMCLGVSGRC